MITDEVKHQTSNRYLFNYYCKSVYLFLEKRTSKEYPLLPLKKSKISKKQKLIFYNYFICYFIILIFCFAEMVKIFLYIIEIMRKNFWVREKSTEVREKSTEHREKSTEVGEKSTEKPSERFTVVCDKKTEELGRKVRRKMPFNSHNPSSLYYPSGYHVHW